MKRREFITLLGGAAAWPLAARAQQGERMRRVGVIYALDAGDTEAEARNRVLEQSLRALGWAVGQDLKIDYRMPGGGADRIRQYAAELAALAPDVIMPVGSATVAPVQQAAPTIPIVMVNVADPVGAGYVASLARPGGNTTGFTNFEYSLSGSWLDRTAGDARGGSSRPHHGGRHRPICRHSVGGAIAHGRDAPSPTSRSSSSLPSPTRPSSPSRTPGC